MAPRRKRRSGPGRPPKPVDLSLVKRLAAIACTQRDIAAVMEVSEDTLQRRGRAFHEAMRLGSGQFSASVKRRLYEVAMMRGDPGDPGDPARKIPPRMPVPLAPGALNAIVRACEVLAKWHLGYRERWEISPGEARQKLSEILGLRPDELVK